MIDCHASAFHHFEHLAPIWVALPPSVRGTFTVAGGILPAVLRSSWGVRPRPGVPHGPGPVLLASWHDVRVCGDRPFIVLEHGAGQAYGTPSPLDTTPDFRHSCRLGLMLCTNEDVRFRASLHHAHAVHKVVGSPRVEHLRHSRIEFRNSKFETREEISGDPRLSRPTSPYNDATGDVDTTGLPTVAFAWHWSPGGALPAEARSAFPHWSTAVAGLAAMPADVRGFEMLGHGHPRAWRQLAAFYRRHGIEASQDSAEVVCRADVTVFDSTSFGFECAAVGIPVVLLDAPWWRRDVSHGFRFWDHADMGLRCGTGRTDELWAAIRETLTSDPCAVRRAEVVRDVYPIIEGSTAEAVEAIRGYAETPRR